jgi:hypothetical protein
MRYVGWLIAAWLIVLSLQMGWFTNLPYSLPGFP